MNKRDFLKTSGILLSGATLSRLVSAESNQTAGPRTNWAGNLTYSTDHLYAPTSVEEVQQTVKRCDKLRALGARIGRDVMIDTISVGAPELLVVEDGVSLGTFTNIENARVAGGGQAHPAPRRHR